MIIDWPASFDAYLDRLDSDAARGDAVAKLTRQILAAQLQELQELQELDSEPVEEDAVLKRVRQSRRYQVWRVAHPFHPLVALRLIAWFPPERPESVVVALFAGDKKAIGDVGTTASVPVPMRRSGSGSSRPRKSRGDRAWLNRTSSCGATTGSKRCWLSRRPPRPCETSAPGWIR